MKNNIRETACEACMHASVCMHKNNYLDMVSRLKDAFHSVPIQKRDGISFQNPICNFCHKELAIPKFMNHDQKIVGERGTAAKNMLKSMGEGLL